MMLIGELAKKAGLTRDTVRFYERMGLITSGEKEAGSRIYKTFDEEALQRLLFIKGGQAGGWTLNEIKETLDSVGTDIDAMPQAQMVAVVEAKIAKIDEKLKRLHEVRDYLATKLERAKNGQSMVGITLPDGQRYRKGNDACGHEGDGAAALDPSVRNFNLPA